MRRRLLRLASMGGASLVLAGVLVVGVGVPAQAAELDDVRSYMLTAPADVSDHAGLTAAEAYAFRDLSRNYGDGRGTVYPISQTVTPALYAAGGSLQVIAGPDGKPRFFQHGEAWPAAAGKPAHVAQTEWDQCKGSGALGLLAAFRTWASQLAGGTDCNAVRSGWGAPLSDTHKPIGLPQTAAGLPLSSSAHGFTLSVGAPIFNTSPRLPGSTLAYGWLYPLNVAGDYSTVHSVRVSSISRATSASGALVQEASNSYTELKGATIGTSSGSQIVAGSLCGAQLCINASRAITTANLTADAMPWLASINLQVWRTSNINDIATGTHTGLGAPAYTSLVMVKMAPPNPDDVEPAEVKLLTTVYGKDGQTYSCTTDGFIEKNGERIPLPCMPAGVTGHNYGPALVEVVPSSEVGTYAPGSRTDRKITTPNPSGPYTEWKATDAECAASKRCVLDLQRSGKSCFDNPDACEKWEEEVAADPGAHPYQCAYNDKPVPIAECSVYGPVFDEEQREAGHAYGPPVSDTGGGGSTSTPTNSGDMDGELIGRGGECFPEGWAPANPVDWGLRPIQCAMEWAFVPSPGAVAQAQSDLAGAVAGSGVGALGDSLGDLGSLFSQPASCGGLPFEWSAYGVTVSERLFDACVSPWDGVANLTNNMIVALSSFLSFLSIWRYIAISWGFVGPGGSIEQTQMITAARVERLSK